ncbi:hypothetical protein H0H92_005458, partial [Tricholoma furcatifolium]
MRSQFYSPKGLTFQQIISWYRWRTQKKARKAESKKIKQMDKIILGSRSRLPQLTEIYLDLYYDERIAPRVKEQLSIGANHTERLNVIKRVTRESWNAEENEVVERVHARLLDLKEKRQAAKDAPLTLPTAEEITENLEDLPAFMGRFLDYVHGCTGWSFSCIMGGPDPSVNDIRVCSYHVGETPGGKSFELHNKSFAQAEYEQKESTSFNPGNTIKPQKHAPLAEPCSNDKKKAHDHMSLEIAHKTAVTPLGGRDKAAEATQDMGSEPGELTLCVGEKAGEPTLCVGEKAGEPTLDVGEKAGEPTLDVGEKAGEPTLDVGEKADEATLGVSEKANEPTLDVGEKAGEPTLGVGEKTGEPNLGVGEKAVVVVQSVGKKGAEDGSERALRNEVQTSVDISMSDRGNALQSPLQLSDNGTNAFPGSGPPWNYAVSPGIDVEASTMPFEASWDGQTGAGELLLSLYAPLNPHTAENYHAPQESSYNFDFDFFGMDEMPSLASSRAPLTFGFGSTFGASVTAEKSPLLPLTASTPVPAAALVPMPLVPTSPPLLPLVLPVPASAPVPFVPPLSPLPPIVVPSTAPAVVPPVAPAPVPAMPVLASNEAPPAAVAPLRGLDIPAVNVLSRSSRTIIPSTRADQLNKIRCAQDKKKLTAGKENTPPGVPPEWMTAAHAHLTTRDLGEDWNRCVNAWVKFEGVLEYHSSKGLSGIKERPEEWAKWTKTHRSYGNTPLIHDPMEFGLAVVKWWRSMQPEVRQSSTALMPLPLADLPASRIDDHAWAPLRKSGPNGMLSVMTLLAWWGQRATGIDHYHEDSRPLWVECVQDVRACLDHLSIIPNRKRVGSATMTSPTPNVLSCKRKDLAADLLVVIDMFLYLPIYRLFGLVAYLTHLT